MDLKLLTGVFFEGILSFLSPCVLPLIPLYMSYLVGDNYSEDENGNKIYDVKSVFLTTLFFVLGISCTFVILAISINALKQYIADYTQLISIIGGTLLIIFGLHELGLIHIDVLNKNMKLNLNLKLQNMSYFKAFLLGFGFSFGWSACIGPMLANAIFLASTSSNGYLYIVVYALGLIIPFLITGLFTSKILNFIQNKKNIVNTVIKIAGIVLIIFGIYMIHTGYKDVLVLKNNMNNNTVNEQTNDEKVDIVTYLKTHQFKDDRGSTTSLGDYEGKYLFLNFTTTWCPYCKIEIPVLEEYAKNDEVEVVFVMSPLLENSEDAIDNYLKESESTLKTIIDEEGVLFYYCNVTSYPTTYVLSPEGEFKVYFTGALNEELCDQLLDYAKNN